MLRYVLLCVMVAFSGFALEPVRCGDGRIDQVIDGFESRAGWDARYRDRDLPAVTLATTEGCAGQALGIRWDMRGGEWFVLVRDLALDLSSRTHLRIALRGTNPNARLNFQIKLMDADGSVFWQVAESVTDLPVWRPMYIDLRELTCFGDAAQCANATLDLARITQVQIGIALCRRDGALCEASDMSGGLDLDELAAVDLRPGSAHRVVVDHRERVVRDPDVRAAAAAAILAHQHANGLVPAWFPEEAPNYNTYTEAVALLVFLGEWQRTSDVRYHDAASRLAAALEALQLSSGAWFSAYDGALRSFDPACTGTETVVNGDDRDVNRCEWVGNVAWALLALVRAREAGINHTASVDAARSWLEAQIGRMDAYPDLMTRGLEGNVSSWFALDAAGSTRAKAFANAVFEHGWDPIERRLKMGAGSTDFGSAIDMSGSWGAQFLRRMGRDAEALASQGYALSIFPTTSFDGTFTGFGDIAGPWTVTVEFGAQAAAAGIAGANDVLRDILRMQRADGSFPGGADEWYGGVGTPWTTTMTGVAPTAWVYFAQNGDPLLRVKRRAARK